MTDTGEDAIRRERRVISEEERERLGVPPGDYILQEIERMGLEREAFKAKLRAMREEGSIFNYTGPRATREGK